MRGNAERSPSRLSEKRKRSVISSVFSCDSEMTVGACVDVCMHTGTNDDGFVCAELS